MKLNESHKHAHVRKERKRQTDDYEYTLYDTDPL